MTSRGSPSITEVMNEDDLSARLRDLGEQPVPDAVRDAHLQRMAAVDVTGSGRREKRFGRLAVAAAALVGFFAGSTGLAMAGALPDPAQGVAHDVLSVVQVEVPDRPDNLGRCISEAVKPLGDSEDPATLEAKKAAKEACKAEHKPGPPEGVGRGNGGGGGPRADHPHAGDECKGPPPWAGRDAPKPPTAEREQFRAGCPADVEDDAPEQEPAG